MESDLLKQSNKDIQIRAKTREEYDKMSREELVEYSRQYGEQIKSCHQSDKNHRYACGWCGIVPDETRIYVSPRNAWTGQRDSRYLCYRCAHEEDQLKTWTLLEETSYWLPIRPPEIPQFNQPGASLQSSDQLYCEAHPTPDEIKQTLFQTPLPPHRMDPRPVSVPYRTLLEEEWAAAHKRSKFE